jgi:hypothetical protein
MQYIGTGNGEYAAQPGQGSFNELSLQEQAYWGASHRAIIKYTDLVTAAPANAASQVLGLAAVGTGNGQLIDCQFARLITPFANSNDATQNTTSVQVGDNETAAQYVAAMETNLNGAYVQIKAGTGAGSAKAYTAADILQILFAAPAAGKSLANLTQGELHVFFRIRDNTLPG